MLLLSDSGVINGLQTPPPHTHTLCNQLRIVNSSVPFQKDSLLWNMLWKAPCLSNGQGWKPLRVGYLTAVWTSGKLPWEICLVCNSSAQLRGTPLAGAYKAEVSVRMSPNPVKGEVWSCGLENVCSASFSTWRHLELTIHGAGGTGRALHGSHHSCCLYTVQKSLCWPKIIFCDVSRSYCV